MNDSNTPIFITTPEGAKAITIWAKSKCNDIWFPFNVILIDDLNDRGADTQELRLEYTGHIPQFDTSPS